MQRILVIDDDPAVTSLLKRGLSYEGFAVETAQSGAEGLAIARERSSDVVILDVMMQGRNGFEVLQRLRTAIRAHVHCQGRASRPDAGTGWSLVRMITLSNHLLLKSYWLGYMLC